MEPEYLTTKEAAIFCRTTPHRLKHFRYIGEGPAYISHGVGRLIVYKRQSLINWMDAIERQPLQVIKKEVAKQLTKNAEQFNKQVADIKANKDKEYIDNYTDNLNDLIEN